MAIRDRGNIKWTSLMLPEHVRELRKYIKEDYYDIQEPFVDDQQMEEMNNLIFESMEYHYPLSFKLYKDKRIISIEGFVHYIDPLKKELRLVDLNEKLHIIPINIVKGIHKK